MRRTGKDARHGWREAWELMEGFPLAALAGLGAASLAGALLRLLAGMQPGWPGDWLVSGAHSVGRALGHGLRLAALAAMLAGLLAAREEDSRISGLLGTGLAGLSLGAWAMVGLWERLSLPPAE